MIWVSPVLPHASTMTLAMLFGLFVLAAHTSVLQRRRNFDLLSHMFTHSSKHVGLDSNSFSSYEHHLPPFFLPHKRERSAMAMQSKR